MRMIQGNLTEWPAGFGPTCFGPAGFGIRADGIAMRIT